MGRRQLPKAYLRVDPNIDAHPDPGTMILLMCEAHRQPRRGRFRHLDRLRRSIGRRQLQGAIDRGDLVEQDDGSWYLEGWDEWQEGDWTVGERVRRVRERRSRVRERRSSGGAHLETFERYTGVSPPCPERSTPSEALGRKGVGHIPPTPPADAGGPPPRPAGVTGECLTTYGLAPSTAQQLCELDEHDALKGNAEERGSGSDGRDAMLTGTDDERHGTPGGER